jgi:N-acetylglucosaminyldiphosphoundecaprenol N-acetyl-beta-D-mannosaminyltransferase
MPENQSIVKSESDRTYILGVGINHISLAQAVEFIDSWIQSRIQEYVCVRDVHGVVECQRDPDLLVIHNNSGLTVPDGMPLVWISKMRGHKDVTRVYGPDLTLSVCEFGQSRGYRHYFYGGKQRVPEELASCLKKRFPKMIVVGCYSPPFGPLSEEEESKVLDEINSARPDIVWVGLSTPKQERWMANHRACLEAPVLIGVGAAFDFLSGRLRQAPRWMMNAGLEWLFRLMMEPRRLWKRYTINNVLFLYCLLLEVIGLKRRN